MLKHDAEKRFIIVFLVGKSLHVDMYATVNETFYTCVIASFKPCVPMSGCVCTDYRLVFLKQFHASVQVCRHHCIAVFLCARESLHSTEYMVNKYKY